MRPEIEYLQGLEKTGANRVADAFARMGNRVKGFVGGVEGKSVLQARQRDLNTLAAHGHMPQHQVMPPNEQGGVFRELYHQARGGVSGAGQAAVDSDVSRAAMRLHGAGVAVPQHLRPASPPPMRQAAAPQAAAAPAAPAANAPGFFRRNAPAYAAGLGTAALGAAAYRGYPYAAEQGARGVDYMNSTHHDITAPFPSMTVTASYAKFASAKLGSPQDPVLLGSAGAAAARSVADTLSQKLIADPIDSIHATIKKRYYDGPEWDKNFHSVVGGDPMLQQLHKDNPTVLPQAFDTIKRFSPSLAKDPLATRSLLRHVTMSGGEMDFATMKMLAETEKYHNESKRR